MPARRRRITTEERDRALRLRRRLTVPFWSASAGSSSSASTVSGGS
jgi:hypothetical protein